MLHKTSGYRINKNSCATFRFNYALSDQINIAILCYLYYCCDVQVLRYKQPNLHHIHSTAERNLHLYTLFLVNRCHCAFSVATFGFSYFFANTCICASPLNSEKGSKFSLSAFADFLFERATFVFIENF